MPSGYLSVTQAAKILDLDRSRVKLLCSQGRIQGAFKVGNAWIIPDPPVIKPPKQKSPG
ncbi:MAG: helix-turn-helix domain-containing protein [Candidatus Micrarchaeota archaeon]|nr:helix-turn-helix domain-containing protein [Candidatus Micrarchaeota archaeon]